MTVSEDSPAGPALGPQLWTHLPPQLRTADGPNPEIEALLQQIWAHAVAAWPQLEVSPSDFLAHVASKIGTGDPLPAALAGLATADLYLACACLHDAPGAVEAFNATVVPALRESLVRAQLPAAVTEDACQEFAARLFVGEPPKIANYGGRGRLESWARISVLRLAHNLRRSTHREVQPTSDTLFDRTIGSDDPELDLFKQKYRQEFRRAFEAGVLKLSPRQRTVLRQYIVDGLSSHELGTLYRVHRATASRWVVGAQAALVEGTRVALMDQLGLGKTEVQSIIRLIQSRLEASVHRLLEEKPDD